jgi:hypothetical protein
MTQVGLLTLAQKDSLVGHYWIDGCLFNPMLDCNDQWMLSMNQINGNTNPDFEWVKNLPLIDFCKKVYPGPTTL